MMDQERKRECHGVKYEGGERQENSAETKVICVAVVALDRFDTDVCRATNKGGIRQEVEMASGFVGPTLQCSCRGFQGYLTSSFVPSTFRAMRPEQTNKAILGVGRFMCKCGLGGNRVASVRMQGARAPALSRSPQKHFLLPPPVL